MNAKDNEGYAIHLRRKHLRSEMVQELALINGARFTALCDRPENASKIHALSEHEIDQLLAWHDYLDRQLVAQANGVVLKMHAPPGQFAPRRKAVCGRLYDILDVLPGDPLYDVMQLVANLSITTLLCGLSPMLEHDIESVTAARSAVLGELRKRLKLPEPPAPRAREAGGGVVGMRPPRPH